MMILRATAGPWPFRFTSFAFPVIDSAGRAGAAGTRATPPAWADVPFFYAARKPL